MTIVAIDGPVGSGKSSVARLVAARLGFVYIDTGAMYRAVGLLATEAGVSLDDEDAVVAVAAGADLHFGPGGRLLAGSRDVADEIRSLAVGAAASRVSALPGVRRLLVDEQRRIAAGADVVMEGRDIGTNVFPAADAKLFVTARADERAARRCAELVGRGEDVQPAEVLEALVERDRRDSERAVAPLRRADDAVELDTTELSLEQAVERATAIVREKTGR